MKYYFERLRIEVEICYYRIRMYLEKKNIIKPIYTIEEVFMDDDQNDDFETTE